MSKNEFQRRGRKYFHQLKQYYRGSQSERGRKLRSKKKKRRKKAGTGAGEASKKQGKAPGGMSLRGRKSPESL